MTSSGRRVKAATMAKLVDLIAHNQPHLEADLVLCYAMFCSSQDFVDLILRQLANLVRVLLHQLLADNPHSNAVQKIVRKSRTYLRLQSFAEENEGEEFASPLRYHIDVSQRDASAGAAPRTSSLWAARPHDTSLPP
ncbi:uncharacterized protein ACA1_331250, partial [Acanthamoeba castellanii str. Neff]